MSEERGNGILYEAVWYCCDVVGVDGSESILELASRLRVKAVLLEKMAADGLTLLCPVERGEACFVTGDPVAAQEYAMIAYDEAGLLVEPPTVADA